MTQVGRKPTPTAQKVLKGTFRKDRHGDGGLELLPPSDTSPPGWLIGHDAIDEWERIVGVLGGPGVLTEGDMSALGHMCNLHGDILSLYRANRSPTAAQLTQLRSFYNEFGLTPASRARVRVPKGGSAKNPFAELEEGVG